MTMTDHIQDDSHVGQDLSEMNDRELLVHALAADGCGPPLLRMIERARDELTAIAALTVGTRAVLEIDIGDIGVMIEGVTRRIDVALELYARQVKGRGERPSSPVPQSPVPVPAA